LIVGSASIEPLGAISEDGLEPLELLGDV